MKRKIVLLCMLLALFAQVRFSQKAITSKLLQKQIENLTFNSKANEPLLSLGTVRAAIIRNKIVDFWHKPSEDKQTHIFITTRISEK